MRHCLPLALWPEIGVATKRTDGGAIEVRKVGPCFPNRHNGIAAARKRGRRPGRPALDRESVSAAQTLVEAGLTAGQAAKQLGIGRATAYRITKAR